MNAKNKETKPVSKEALWKRQQRSRQNEENEKRDEKRKQNKIRTKTFRERQKKVELELNGHLTNSFSNRTMRMITLIFCLQLIYMKIKNVN
jgi:hypothetical protein